MSDKEIFERMKSAFKGAIQCVPATVVSVNEVNLSCVVTLFDETEIPDVRLKASIDEEIVDGLVEIPEVGSTVLVGLISNNESDRFVLKCSKVVRVLSFGGLNGPVVIWEDKLKTELDKVKSLLTNLINVINGAPIAEAGSGAPSSFQAALQAAVAADELPDFEDLTDQRFLH